MKVAMFDCPVGVESLQGLAGERVHQQSLARLTGHTYGGR
jgi:hypothetical protein